MKSSNILGCALAVSLILCSGNAIACVDGDPGATQAQTEVSWAWNKTDGETLFQQGTSARGVCAGYLAVATGTIVTSQGVLGDVMKGLINMPQQELVHHAARAACIGGDAADQVAIRLFQVVQCHNSGLVDWIENNQDSVRCILRRHGKALLGISSCPNTGM